MKIKYNKSIFYVVLIFVSMLSFYLFYNFCNTDYVNYVSDFHGHTETVMSFVNDSIFPLENHMFPHQFAFPLFHITTAILFKIVNRYDIAASLTTVIANFFTMILIRYIGKDYADSELKKYIIDFVSITIIFLMSISGLLNIYPNFPQLSINAWYSPTYIFMRPFSIYCVILANLFFNKYSEDNEIDFKLLITFSIFLLLSTLAKPSFTIMFLFAFGFHTLILLFKDLKKYFKPYGISLLLAVLPTLILLLLQNWFVGMHTPVDLSFNILSIDSITKNCFRFFKYFISLQILNLIFLLFDSNNNKLNNFYYFISLMMLLPSAFIWFLQLKVYLSLSDYAWSYQIASFFLTLFTTFNIVKKIKFDLLIYYM